MTRTASAFALLTALALPAMAQEELVWIDGTTPEAANLLYGLPNSDFIRLGFHCDPITFGVVVGFYPDNDAADGMTKADLGIDGGTLALTLPGTVAHLEMMDDFLIEAALPVDEDLRTLLTGGPTLTFTFDAVPLAVPAPPVDMAEAFIAACAAFRG